MRISARSHETLCAQSGGVEDAVTEIHCGSPDRLCKNYVSVYKNDLQTSGISYLIDVTSQPLATADLHILEPKNPLPPQTTIRFAAAIVCHYNNDAKKCERKLWSGNSYVVNLTRHFEALTTIHASGGS